MVILSGIVLTILLLNGLVDGAILSVELKGTVTPLVYIKVPHALLVNVIDTLVVVPLNVIVLGTHRLISVYCEV